MDDLRAAYDTALTHVRASRLTDAEFIYTPSQTALACLDLASPVLASAWMRSKSGEGPEDAINHILEPIKAMILEQGSPPDVEAVREVDRRLKLCKNPEKIPGSNAYNKRLAEKQRKADEKRLRKAELVRKAMEDGDPFGSTLANHVELDDDDDDD
jgi:cyclin H